MNLKRVTEITESNPINAQIKMCEFCTTNDNNKIQLCSNCSSTLYFKSVYKYFDIETAHCANDDDLLYDNLLDTVHEEIVRNKRMKLDNGESESPNLDGIESLLDVAENIKAESIEFAEAISKTKIQTAPKQIYSHLPLPNESRMKYLLRVPSIMQAAINSSNFVLLKNLLDFAFTENCLYKTPYLEPIYGRDLILKTFKTVVNVFPDWFILFSKPQAYHRCITVAMHLTGTGGRRTGIELQPNESDYLYNFLKCIPEENMDEKMLILKQKYEKIMSENKLFRVVQVSTLFLVLNEEKTHIEKRIVHNHSFDLFEI